MLTSDIKKQLEEYCSVTVPYEICGFDVVSFIFVAPIVMRDGSFRFDIHLDARHKEHGALGVCRTDVFDHKRNDINDEYANHFIDSMKREIDDAFVFLCQKILKTTKAE